MKVNLLAPDLIARIMRVYNWMGHSTVLHVDCVDPRCRFRPHSLNQRGIRDRPTLRCGELLEKLSQMLWRGHIRIIAGAHSLTTDRIVIHARLATEPLPDRTQHTAVDFGRQTVEIRYQLQRGSKQLLHRQTKTEGSDAELPFPTIVGTALRGTPRRPRSR